jgi:hypothetical protein
MLFTACKNEQESQQELRGITYDQMQQGVLENKIKVPKDIVYYSIDGVIKTLVANGENAIFNPTATTWFVNKQDSIVEVHLLSAVESVKQLENNKLVNELSTATCDSQKAFFKRLEMRSLQVNANEDLNEILASQNMEALMFVLKTCGFPNLQNAGEDGMQTVWSILQNAPVETRGLYFPQVIEASKNGDLERQDVALMQDKMLMDYGKPQLYGSQVLRDDSGNFTLYNLDKPAQVDARRAIMGMTPLKEYLDYFKVDFDVPQTAALKTESK